MAERHDEQEGQVELTVDYRASPLAIPSDKTLSFEARVLLTWLFQHGSGWKFIIGYALKTIGISQSTWKRRVRRELIARGFFVQRQLAGREGEPGFRWSNVFTDKPLRLWCQNVPVQTEPVQDVQIQDDTTTESLIVNKISSQQKRESKKKSGGSLSIPRNPEPEPPAPLGRVWQTDREKEARDIAEARRLGEAGGLSEEEIAAVIDSVQYPSQAPAAARQAAKVKAAAAALSARQARDAEDLPALNREALAGALEIVRCRA